MRHLGTRWSIGLGFIAMAVIMDGEAKAQVGSYPTSGAMSGGVGLPVTNPYANPFSNPVLNPYMNPAMMQQPVRRDDMLLYFMAAQQARRGAPGRDAVAAQAPAGRVSPSRPLPNGPVPGRFDVNPSFNDGRSRLADRFPAYGSVAVDGNTGQPLVPSSGPAPDRGLNHYFNRQPSRNGYNRR